MKTKSERFVEERIERWRRLKDILVHIRKKSFRKLEDPDVRDFPSLYRTVCSDLAEAKSLKLSPDVVNYLNNVAGQAHKYLYGLSSLKKNEIKEYFFEKIPAIVIDFRHFVILSAAIFYGSFFITMVVVNNNPDIAKRILPQILLNSLEEMHSGQTSEKRSGSLSAVMVSYYIYNNTSIAFASFAAGVLFGAGTVYLLLYNGIFLGTVFGYLFSTGKGGDLLRFICAHSAFELSGLVISGAAGLYLGYSIIRATRYKRKDWIKLQKKNLILLIVASAMLILTAAFIEGFVSPSLMPLGGKILVGAASTAFLIFYFFYYPLRKRVKKNG